MSMSAHALLLIRFIMSLPFSVFPIISADRQPRKNLRSSLHAQRKNPGCRHLPTARVLPEPPALFCYQQQELANLLLTCCTCWDGATSEGYQPCSAMAA